MASVQGPLRVLYTAEATADGGRDGRAKTSDGKFVAEPTVRGFNAPLEEATAARIREKGLSFTNSLQLAPGSYTVWFVVRDTLSGQMGTLVTPLVVER